MITLRCRASPESRVDAGQIGGNMAENVPSGSSPAAQDPDLAEALREYIRAKGSDYLKDPNITSVGIGRKNGTGPISLQFTVGSKTESAAEMLEMGTSQIPTTIRLPNGMDVPTDVLERSFKASYQVLAEREAGQRRTRVNPLCPGISVGTVSQAPDAGTIGLIVFDRRTGSPCILSNWHVLHGNQAVIGSPTYQPGSYDDNNVAGNGVGSLLRSHIGDAGDCALARIGGRGFTRQVYGLDVTPRRIARVELDDKLIKSGRTTGITYGIVRRTDVMAKIDYRLPTGVQAVGGFEIGVDPEHPPTNGEISQGGDSGSAWLIADGDAATDIFAGLHFGGETGTNPDEHALACYPQSVQQKMDFTLEPPFGAVAALSADENLAVPRSGYDPSFLQTAIPLPTMREEVERDALPFENGAIIPYTHFSVCLSRNRRMARFVAWNIDGTRMVSRPRRDFKLDPRIDAGAQIGNEAYIDNKLDRGHLARRADLCWGSIEEAEQANRDSNFYPNIAPQHERYNQSSRKGLWGNLENLVLEQVDVKDVRVSVFAGPLFGDDDLTYRDIRLPAAFWKVIAYRGLDERLRMSAFILSQRDLLSDLETLDLDPFRLYQTSLAELAERSGLTFVGAEAFDVQANPDPVVPLRRAEVASSTQSIREIITLGDVRL